MRPTRKRKALSLRFESLEPRTLRAGGIIPNDTLFSQQWGLNNSTNNVDIDAPQAWAITTGSPKVVVADVGSSGVNLSNPDLAGKLWVNPNPNSDPLYPGAVNGWDFSANSPNISDSDGHGTNVAGIIGAASNNGQGIAGVAWASPIMALKGKTVSQDAKAVRFAVDHGAKVINMSFGYTYDSPVTVDFLRQFDPLYQAIQYADSKDVVVVVAAGNSGTAGVTSGIGQDLASTPVYPAAFRLPNMINVAAVDSSGNLASFSNYGATTVDLAAPGVQLSTTGLASQNNYIDFAGGTSFAAPYVSGVAALVAAQHPEYSAEQIVQRIVTTTKPLDSLAGKTISGGMVDAYLALKAGLPDNSSGIAIAAGSATGSGAFVAETSYYSGGAPYTIPDPNQVIDTSNVTNPAPQSVYRTERFDSNSFTYTAPGLVPGIPYQVRLDFSENFYNGAGQRTFGVAINGNVVLPNLDIYAAAGGKFKAIARTFTAIADSSGKISLVFFNTTPGNTPGHPTGGAKVDGITITPLASATPATSDPNSNPDLALGRPVHASTIEGAGYLAAAAIDGDPSTRWSSGQWMQSGSTAWLYVDLGSPQLIGEVRLNWETAFGVDYQIQASNDASSWTTIATVAGNQTSGIHSADGLAETARYVRVYCTRTSSANNNYSLFDFNVYATSQPDLAQGKPTYASSVEGPGYLASRANDGSGSTRWSSGQWMQSSDVGWIYVDLGSSRSISKVRLDWETAYGVDYQIQMSDDASRWTTLVNVSGNNTAGVHDFDGLAGSGRYVRIYATKTSPGSDNYSLYNLSVYG
ncbi:S8 family serine peptidase [Tundrisphaera lichenicola]|uniref:S8 family serine peptidase n=1 Tax=Tundrisphaera lichenicola TaxID=2029860 RepID=UPI003EC09E35